ncbi:5957_t:CDS:2 [Funneliformis geosporum]|uniref:5957_t:CDS:1 n=1 Tax=Funneliformis geosporum TaxID=1117311 RepID=A0A9W4WN73_9GLOM|nr:5957_t:CDS:2 [Funneliformis geosporum]
MYLGLPSENRRQDFLKIPEHSKGLELDIYYPEYGFAIEVQYLVFFHRGDPNHVIKQQLERDSESEAELILKELVALVRSDSCLRIRSERRVGSTGSTTIFCFFEAFRVSC